MSNMPPPWPKVGYSVCLQINTIPKGNIFHQFYEDHSTSSDSEPLGTERVALRQHPLALGVFWFGAIFLDPWQWYESRLVNWFPGKCIFKH